MAAFGRKQVARAQNADEQRTAQGLDESVPGEESHQPAPIAVSAPPVQTPAPAPPPASPALGRPSFRPNTPAPPAAPVAGARPHRMPSVAKPPAAAAAPIASGASQFAPRSSNPSPAPASRSPGGYESRLNESRRSDGLSLRLERALDEVCDYNGYTQEQREEYKSRAAKNPAAWEERILKFYNETIKPARLNTVRSLEEAIAKRPGKVVFMVVRNGKSVPHEKTPEEAGAESLFHNTTVEQVRASHTPFRSPRDVYGRADANSTVTSEDAMFEEPVAATRAPRP